MSFLVKQTDVNVQIRDDEFFPKVVTVGLRGTVHWENLDIKPHTVTEAGEATIAIRRTLSTAGHLRATHQ